MPSALELVEPSLAADELAWLATLPDVECRLVFTETAGNRTTYRVQDGPFTEAELASLPARDWTLLVQDVEKHLPDFRAFFAAADFIPDWRIDDLMVSCAAPGGSVGPHRDNYDVFLCQGSGKRKWKLGDSASAVVDSAAEQLSLLMPFAATNTDLADTGDVLYLPPGTPHWGVAEDLCVTYSIGMRAPNKAELASAADRLFGVDAGDTTAGSIEEVFYSDANLESGEAEPGSISARSIQRLRDQELLSREFSDEQLAAVLGSVVTDTKAWLTPDLPEKNEVTQIVSHLGSETNLSVHGMARIAYSELPDSRWIFANGFVRELHPQDLDIARELCSARVVCTKAFDGHSESAALIEWLLLTGAFDLVD